MYDDLVRRLRKCATEAGACKTCELDSNPSCTDVLMEQAADAIEQLCNAGSAYGRGWTLGYDAGREESKPRWIPVTERLPEGEKDVLVWVSIGKAPIVAYDVDCYNEHAKRWVCFENDVTHWMPLPPAPKEE